MNSSDVPSKIIDCSLVEILPDGRTVSLGLFTRRGLAVSLQNRFPQLSLEIRPWHPEFPGFSKVEGIRT